ncbi:MAG: GGDEF domain-containing protein [Gammaproteobacteria bacterium]
MKRNTEVHILVTLSILGAIAILPVAVLRMLNADWIIFTIDLILISAMVILGIYVFITQRVRFVGRLISIVVLSGVVIIVYLKGHEFLYWAYPTMVSVFYLLKPRTASLITFIALAILVPALIRDMDILIFIVAIITLVVTIVFAYVFSSQKQEQSEQLSLLIRKDPLTGVGNRRALEEKLNEYTISQHRTKMIASLIMIDLDHFKNINDIYGHIVGDQVLVKLTEIINGRIRISDNLYRFGGEEFVIIAIGTSVSSAETLAEELRSLIESATLLPDAVTISLGVAEYEQGETGEDWIHRCDSALYEAKNMGRNKVCIA